MTKINAVLLLALFPILYLNDARQHNNQSAGMLLADFLRKSGAALGSLLIVVFVTFYIHAAIARIPPSPDTVAGHQDLENMSASYRQFLDHHEALTPSMVAIITRDYFQFMNKDHRGVPKLDITKPGENGSHPLHWPLHDKTINYRWDSSDGKTSYVQLAGNQVSWYLGLIAVLLSLQLISNHRVFGLPIQGNPNTYRLIEAFTGLYAAFMLLHLWIITQRVMYLYHYFLGLLISFILIALIWQYLRDTRPKLARNQTKILACGTAVIFLSFWFFLPLTNHRPLTFDQCERRNVIERIVECVQ
jgi:dolichyl-phosphate-mannose-protein mannosyltransferase